MPYNPTDYAKHYMHYWIRPIHMHIHKASSTQDLHNSFSGECQLMCEVSLLYSPIERTRPVWYLHDEEPTSLQSLIDSI